jgi:hypothetical protein
MCLIRIKEMPIDYGIRINDLLLRKKLKTFDQVGVYTLEGQYNTRDSATGSLDDRIRQKPNRTARTGREKKTVIQQMREARSKSSKQCSSRP